MNLPYFAADTLGVTLYAVKGGLSATEVYEVALGPWRIDLPIEVTSDVMSGVEIGLWVTLASRLRLYVLVRSHESWMYILSEDALKACGQQTGFAGRTVKARLEEIKPAIKAVFRWKSTETGWAQMQYNEVTTGG